MPLIAVSRSRTTDAIDPHPDRPRPQRAVGVDTKRPDEPPSVGLSDPDRIHTPVELAGALRVLTAASAPSPPRSGPDHVSVARRSSVVED